MKQFICSICLLLVAGIGFSQAPLKFNYQAVARNAQGQFIPNANINIRLSLLGSGTAGILLYTETRKVTTSNVGLFSLVIGSPGATTSTGSIATVDWSQGNINLKVEIDPLGGTNFIQIGNTELVSVPYALYAVNGKKGDQGIPGAPGVQGPRGDKGDKGDVGSPGIDSQTLNISGNVLSISNGNSVTLPTGGGGNPTGPAGGDLSGTYPNPTVAKLQSQDVSTTAPANGQVLKFNAATNKWEPGTDNTGTGGTGGDNWGTQAVVSNTNELSGNGTAATPLRLKPGASAGQVLKWDGSNWAPGTDNTGGGGGGSFTLPYAAAQASATSPLFAISNTSATGNAASIYGTSNSIDAGASPTSGPTAIMGEMPATSSGFSAAVRGINRSTGASSIGVVGYQAGSGYGVYAEAPFGFSVYAKSNTGYGIYTTTNSGFGIYGSASSGTGGFFTSSTGLALRTGIGYSLFTNSITAGRSSVGNGNNGVNGYSTLGLGVYGNSTAGGGAGVQGDGAYIGVQGTVSGTNANRQAVRGENGSSPTGFAGVFTGTVGVFGTLSKTAGSFLIDHPVDPANKFLVHSFVESPDMKNIYDGVVTTDAAGNATVTMPDWFQALNVDFRYQLTCMGQFAQAIIATEISGNRFSIKTDKPNVKVSWQVTGTRNDPYARDNRLPVEKAKRADEKGKYIYPEGYGKGKESALDVIRNGATQSSE